MKSSLNTIATIGLALGAVFGMAGTIVAQPNLRNTFWGIDSAGLVMAASSMAVKFFSGAKRCCQRHHPCLFSPIPF